MTSALNADKHRIAVPLVNGTGLCVHCLEQERTARTFGGYGRAGRERNHDSTS